MATSSRAAAPKAWPPRPASRAFSLPATCRTTSIARRSPARAAAAWRRSTRRNTSMASPPEDDDFRRAVADAEPLVHRRKVLRGKRPAPIARQRLRDEHAALAESLAGPVTLDDALDSGD